MSDTGWLLFIPPVPGTQDIRPSEDLWPCPTTDEPLSADRLAVVVSVAADLACVRDLMVDIPEGGKPRILLWSWHMPEQVAVDAESIAPVLYGPLTVTEMDNALAQGITDSPTTRALSMLEQAVGFDSAYALPAL